MKTTLVLLLVAAAINVQCQTNTIATFYDPILNLNEPCYYTCASCTGYDYNMCTTCNPLRGIDTTGVPINGACECINNMDESTDGYCVLPVVSSSYSLAAVILLIINCVLILFTTCTKGLRFFLYRMIEDFQ